MGKKKKLTVADLAELIRKNPQAWFQVDNDCWFMYKGPAPTYHLEPSDNEEDDGEDYYHVPDSDDEQEEICSSSDMGYTDNGYGSGECYGGDILQALALIVGVKVESV